MSSLQERPSVLEILNRNSIGIAPSLFDLKHTESSKENSQAQVTVPFSILPRNKSDDDPSTASLQPIEADTNILWNDWYERLDRLPPLSPEEMIKLATIYEHGIESRKFLEENNPSQEDLERLQEEVIQGDVAFETMFSHNLRLVRNMAIRWRTYVPGMNIEDVFQAGAIGLHISLTKWDWRRGYNFSTYATNWIKQSIQRDSLNFHGHIRQPIHRYDEIYFERATSRWLKSDGTRLEIGPTSDYWPLQEMFSMEILQDEPELHGLAIHSDDVEAIDEEEYWEWIRRFFLYPLDERSKEVLEMRFGFERNENSTLDVIGKSMGVTRERVRQIEIRALLEVKIYILSVGLSWESVRKDIDSKIAPNDVAILEAASRAVSERDLRKKLKKMEVSQDYFEEILRKGLDAIFNAIVDSEV